MIPFSNEPDVQQRLTLDFNHHIYIYMISLYTSYYVSITPETGITDEA